MVFLRSTRWLTLVVVVLLGFAASGRKAPAAGEPKGMVYFDRDGRLVYSPGKKGDVIPDFSFCGYRGGGVRIPDVAVKITLRPGNKAADDTDRTQKAIDRVSKMQPDKNGFRGAVLLEKGTYRVAGTLNIKTSGVVLRGTGQHAGGTVILATGNKKRTLIQVSGKGGEKEVKDSRRRITDQRVPVGARSLAVDKAKGFSPGDRVVIHRPSTKEWIHAIGMDRLPKGSTQWKPGKYDLRFERTITKIKGRTIHFDAPVVNALEEEYGGGFVYKVRFPGRISQVGVEKLRLVSEYRRGKEKSDEKHAWNGVELDRVENAWVRQVTSVHFGYGCVQVRRRAVRVTVEDCACLDPVSKISGGRRYSFSLAGQLALVQRCYARNGRHDFVMHSRAAGPNVLLDCLAEKCHSDNGPHHRWSTGTLYDNVKGRSLNVQDRQGSGTGHGWAGSQMVFWNCVAKSIICQRPPTSQNYAIGCKGKRSGGRHKRQGGHWESHGNHVKPRSLYLKQLEDRLGPGAVASVATAAQLKGNVYTELRRKFLP